MQTVFEFIMENGRCPCLEDTPRPWEYQGWLLPYVQEIHAQGHCGARWAWHLAAVHNGALPDGPIPQVKFAERDSKVMSLLDSWCRIVGWDMGGWSDFHRLLEWLGFALGVSAEAPKLSDKANEQLYKTVDIGPILATPYDYIGAWISEHKAKGWNPTAFYPTPHQVCECMVAMQFHDLEGDPRVKSVCDPCVGTGRMLLHASNYSVNLFGQDCDPVVALACKINGALYAPWIAFPFSQQVLNSNKSEAA